MRGLRNIKMEHSQIVLSLIHLVSGGAVSFLAILLWSKTRDTAWSALAGGAVISYCGVIFNMLSELGIMTLKDIYIKDVSLTALAFTVLPDLFFIFAFIVMIIRSTRR